MSNNIQKYENWRAITESDYVTMFIKTWFAFVATLRELYPKDNLSEVIGKGDKVFLNPYLDDFQSKYFYYNRISTIKEDILKVYKLGRDYTLENSKYNRFFAEDFYILNKGYSWKKATDDYECSIKYSSDFVLSVYVKYLDKCLYMNGTPLIVSEKIDISDLISSENLEEHQIFSFLDDEASYINFVTNEIINRVSIEFISKITSEEFTSKYSPKSLIYLNSLSLSINADLVSALALMRDPSIKKDNLLFSQSPCSNFIYKAEDGADVPEIDTYKWFLNFVYFMRNALFHEIIDPLDTFWQEIFKHSYLALKEILNGNINYFLEKEDIEKLIYELAWNEVLEKKDVYVPNFNENYNNADLEIELINYSVDESDVEIKANISFDYWYDAYSMKRMFSVCKSKILRSNKTVDKFKMRLLRHEDIQL